MTVLIFLDKLLNRFPLLSQHWVTISARTGYASIRGKAWAKVAEPLIDAVFGKGHCYLCAVAEGLIA